MIKRINKKNNGYTIIETMITISLFIIIMTSGMAALLNANLLHQKSQNMRSIMDNLSFMIEDMSRNLRTGYSYHCFETGDTIPSTTSPIVSTPKSCGTGWAIAFESDYGDSEDDDDQWLYYISNGKIYKSTAGPYTESSFIQLTSDEIVIDATSSFAVLGAEPPPGDLQQPFVTIRLVGEIIYKPGTTNSVVTPFSLQTSVSQRLIDV